MLKKLFHIKTILLTIFFSIGALFYLSRMLPLEVKSFHARITPVDFSSFSTDTNYFQMENNIEKYQKFISDELAKKKQERNFLLSYAQYWKEQMPLFPDDITLSYQKDEKNFIYQAKFHSDAYQAGAVADTFKLVVDRMQSDSLEAFQNRMDEVSAEIVATEALINQILTKNEENVNKDKDKENEKNQPKPEKEESKKEEFMNVLPKEITSSIKKFKEYKTSREKRLTEVEQEIINYPELGSTNLPLLTSNLQKNYLLEIEGYKTQIYLSSPTQDKLTEIQLQIKSIEAKLNQENIRLRDEAHFMKQRQDQALRLKLFSLKQEEQNLKETIAALSEFQKFLFTNDQQVLTTQKGPNEVRKEKQAETAVSNVNIKDLTNKLALLKNNLNDISLAKETLVSNHISNQMSTVDIQPIDLVSNRLIQYHMIAIALLMLLFTATLFGPKNKIMKGLQAANILGVPFLGNIPDIPNEGLENAKNKKLADAIDGITSKLETIIEDREIKTLNIISLSPEEGRTQLVGMLSLSLNLRKEMKIIGIDFCVNNPQLNEFLALKNKMLPTEDGLVSYLNFLQTKQEVTESENNQWLAKLVKPCVKNGIFVISPGKGSLEDKSLINPKALRTMHEGLGRYVELMITDTSPLNSSLGDLTKTIAENSDSSLILIKKGLYAKSDIESIKLKLGESSIAGIIFKG